MKLNRNVILVVICAMAINVNLFSQWSTNPTVNNAVSNTLITGPYGQGEPDIIPDGHGGMFVTWQDSVNCVGPTCHTTNIYANRVSPDGNLLWGVNGVPICTAYRNQSYQQIFSDGNGGAIIVWQDRRNFMDYNIYAQKVDSSGIIQWPLDGVVICNAATDQLYPQLINDNNGGAIITWLDYRNGVDVDLYAQRIDANGIPIWTSNGIVVCDVEENQWEQRMVSDLAGGAIVTWTDFRDSVYGDIYAQRIDPSGNMLWTYNGLEICDTSSWQYGPAMVEDEFGGAIIVWADSRDPSSGNIYAQRVNGAGVVHWTTNGVQIGTAPLEAGNPNLVADQTGGAIIGWEVYNFPPVSSNIYAQHISNTGVIGGPISGIPICTVNNDQTQCKLSFDGQMSAYLTWQDKRSGNWDVYAQKIDTNGVVQFATNGIIISNASDDQSAPVICTDNSGGALLVWSDKRNFWHVNTFAQRINAFGSLCGVLPTVTINASPGISICDSTAVTFTANITNGGSSPSYQWQINGANVGANSNTYIDSTLNDGDIVTCILTSTDPCASPFTATSTPDTITVLSTSTPTISILASPSTSICNDIPITFSSTSTNGGTMPTYQWLLNGTNVGTNANSYIDSTFSNLDSVQCILTSSNICAPTASVNSNLIVINVNADTDITGHVTYTGGDLADGSAVLYEYNPFYAAFDTTQVQLLDATGHYHFSSVPVGNYLLKIYPDTITYPDITSTYYFDQWVWDSATVINHSCWINDTMDVVMIELNLGGGFGLFHGQIIEGYGWGRNVGDPIENLDVKVYSLGGSEVVASTFTDMNGYFTFENIPNGNYSIIVDIPGLERTLIHSVIVDTISTEYLCLDYIVDSVSIYYPQPCSANTSGVENSTTLGLLIYPNPTGHFLNMVCSVKMDNAQLEITNLTGQTVKCIREINLQPGENYVVDMSSLKNGVYFLRLNNTTKIVVVN